MNAIVIMLGIFFVPRASALGQSGEAPLLEYSYTGKQGPSSREFMRVMTNNDIQKALLEIASEPRDELFLDKTLDGTGVTKGNLEELRLIRKDGNAWVIGFTLFTSADMDKIRAVAEVEGKRLAAILLDRRTEIRDTLMSKPQSGADWKTRAYFILGCISLDWDGLNLLEKKKYLVLADTDRYIPFARQTEGGGSIQKLYWGSHNMHDRIALTSFGDHHSLPRQALPDLLWSIKKSLKTDDAPESIISPLVDAADAPVRQRIGRIMLALRSSDRTVEQLADAADISNQDALNLMGFLVDLKYVEKNGNRYRAIIPILTEQDQSMVKKLRRLGRDVILEWLDERHEILAQELSNLTPQRHGVPLKDSFYTVWHYIFGIANRELVAEGLFADPYDSGRTYKGFIPAVYLLNVAQGGY